MMIRDDLSEWVVHFVHGVTADSEWVDRYGEPTPIPIAFDEDGNAIVLEHQRNRLPATCEMSPFEVLLQIVDDGYLQTSWSFRYRAQDDTVAPTVYGARSALCFTEMPLYALAQYQEKRALSGYVEKYAIAVKKYEFFAAGGRQVITGLSGVHEELDFYGFYVGESNSNEFDADELGVDELNFDGVQPEIFCRFLSPKCGIGEREQYRYVAMNVGGDTFIDWSHEREWRWTKNYDVLDEVPGLPLWLADRECDPGRKNDFSEIIIITETEDQVSEVVDKLRVLYDSRMNGFRVPFDGRRIRSTKVTSFETIALKGVRHIRDLRFTPRSVVRKVEFDDEVSARAGYVVELARQAAKDRVLKLREERPESDFDFCGSSDLILKDSHNIYVQALFRQGVAKASGGEGYVIRVNDNLSVGQSMFLSSSGCEAAGEILSQELGIEYDVKDYPD